IYWFARTRSNSRWHAGSRNRLPSTATCRSRRTTPCRASSFGSSSRNEAAMSERKVVGINPWLPWPLCDWPWWTEPIRAERLAALRIGVAAVLLFDVLWNYLPLADDFFGRGSLGSPEIFAGNRAVSFRWSLLAGVPDRTWLLLALVTWAVAA